MTQHSTQFEATEGGMVLTNAILLYGSEGHQLRAGAQAFASFHAVEHDQGAPTIAAGTPLSRAHLRQWTEALSKAVAPEILPGNVLVSHPDMMAWWVPEKIRSSYFDLYKPAGDLKVLGKRTNLSLPYPAHLFVATRGGLGVYALQSSARPNADTPVLHSPVLNVYIGGSLCWGTIPKPKALTIAAIPEFERAVFDSWSTHPNPGQEMTVTGKGGLVRLWDDLAASKAKRFPVKRMKPFGVGARRQPVTFGKLVAGKAGA